MTTSPPQVPVNPTESYYADPVHLVLIRHCGLSAEAETLAVPYLVAIVPVEECTEMRAVHMAADEFTIRGGPAGG